MHPPPPNQHKSESNWDDHISWHDILTLWRQLSQRQHYFETSIPPFCTVGLHTALFGTELSCQHQAMSQSKLFACNYHNRITRTPNRLWVYESHCRFVNLPQISIAGFHDSHSHIFIWNCSTTHLKWSLTESPVHICTCMHIAFALKLKINAHSTHGMVKWERGSEVPPSNCRAQFRICNRDMRIRIKIVRARTWFDSCWPVTFSPPQESGLTTGDSLYRGFPIFCVCSTATCLLTAIMTHQLTLILR